MARKSIIYDCWNNDQQIPSDSWVTTQTCSNSEGKEKETRPSKIRMKREEKSEKKEKSEKGKGGKEKKKGKEEQWEEVYRYSEAVVDI